MKTVGSGGCGSQVFHRSEGMRNEGLKELTWTRKSFEKWWEELKEQWEGPEDQAEREVVFNQKDKGERKGLNSQLLCVDDTSVS